jgi:CheY-like chemotaxis protein
MKKALVVEDNIINQKVITRFLERLGFHVEIAENGVQGVNCFKASAFDVVFMDLMMPEMDGFEATRRIREYEREQGITNGARAPIIAVTANVNATEASCLASGMNGYMNKPLRLNTLQDIIWSLVDRQN